MFASGSEDTIVYMSLISYLAGIYEKRGQFIALIQNKGK